MSSYRNPFVWILRGTPPEIIARCLFLMLVRSTVFPRGKGGNPTTAATSSKVLCTVVLHCLALSCFCFVLVGGPPPAVGTTWGNVFGEVLRIGRRGRGDEAGMRARVRGLLGVPRRTHSTCCKDRGEQPRTRTPQALFHQQGREGGPWPGSVRRPILGRRKEGRESPSCPAEEERVRNKRRGIHVAHCGMV